MRSGSPNRSVLGMTTFYDVPADLLIGELSKLLSERDAVNMPEWATYVKTGVHRENPPSQDDWWAIRSAAILRKVGTSGPVGVNQLASMFGGPRERNSRPNRAKSGSRHIIRTILIQLQEKGYVESVLSKVIEDSDGEKMNLYKGRALTSTGQKILDEAAYAVRNSANELYEGLAKY